MYKQIIIARKDLNLSPGKLATQVAHGSMTFLSYFIKNNIDLNGHIDAWFDESIYEQWINSSYTKIVLQARNKNQLLKAKTMAEELGMKEGEDFFLIKDNCRTELKPEEFDENGVGRTLTCIGFKPMDSEVIDKISKKFHMYV